MYIKMIVQIVWYDSIYFKVVLVLESELSDKDAKAWFSQYPVDPTYPVHNFASENPHHYL